MINTFLLATLLIHPVHETLAEIEWNEQSKRLEVALRLHTLDEQWLSKHNRRQQPVEKWALTYLRQNLRIAPLPKEPDGDDPTKYHWVGRQSDGAHVWWYFELEPTNGQQPAWIENRVLFEREDNYINRILVLNEQPKRSLTLSRKRPRGQIGREVLKKP